MSVTVNILYFPGTNCQRETAVAFERVGARPRLTFLTEVLVGRQRLDDADLLCLPGGFSFGDHAGAGTVAALHLTTRVADQLAACRKRPVLCICNGFQIAVRAGLFGPGVTLTVNERGTFYHVREQEHFVEPGNDSFWLDGLRGETLRFPCAHGEGRFLFEHLEGWKKALTYPPGRNPDSSMEGVAGITTPDGLVLGLMNHLERAPQHPFNLEILRNGVRWAGR
ncbi:MAG TPA: phosphoribosylformylglycinamidine synthase subunit PurQ [Gemmataceae bacterium]|nr:phosphoribosylformylglycinamidine synthase subunit PurQ [Gemmataceae bacterium]